MNKLLGVFILVMISFSMGSCKKQKIEVESFDFSYADDIEGTYIGIRRQDYGPYSPNAIHQVSYDTVIVEISDHRNSKTCKFKFDLWDDYIVLRPNMTFYTNYRYNTNYGNHKLGELSIKNGIFRYSEYYKLQWDKYNDALSWHKVLNLVLVKQE